MKELRPSLRPLFWVSSSKKDYLTFPAEVVDQFGFDLYRVQLGGHPRSAKTLTGFGSGVWELVDQFDGNAFRTVYTVRFPRAIYVLHAFQKKSKRGAGTPQIEIDLIKRRLAYATDDYAKLYDEEAK